MPPVDIKQAWVNLGNGVLVERDVYDIARRVTEYDPNLKVQFLNDAALGPGEAPYRIVENCKDGIERPVFSVWVLDETVLQRIFAADNQKFDVQGFVDKTNAKARNNENNRYKEALSEAREITTTVLKSPKSTFSVPEDVLKGDKGDPNKLIKFRDTPA